MAMDYSRIGDWILREDCFDAEHLGKCEAVMSLGNGYLGFRSATEECYLGETRDLLINGTFNKFDPSAVTELPNAADMTAMEIRINQERFTLEQGTVDSYSRELNIKTAELKREMIWTSPKGHKVKLMFCRVVSLNRLHDFVMQVELTPLSGDISVELKSGIDGRVTNTGAQHFTDGDMRFYEGWKYTAVRTAAAVRINPNVCINTMPKRIQTEGHFGDIKENENFRRFNYRSGEKVYKEFMLYAIGRNIMKYHRFLHHEIKKYEGKQEKKTA